MIAYPTKKLQSSIAKISVMKFISKSNSALIEPGDHLATIRKVYTDKASTGAQQLAVEFVADGKQITRWYNLKGFKISTESPTIKDASGRTVPNYLTGKNGKRLEDPAKTESCLSIIGQLGANAGIPLGSDFEPADLEGEQVGICVESEDNGFGPRLNVRYTMPAEEVADSAEASDFL
ncbi:MAG TPA: hypothetical protein DIT95_08815 [Arenibacter sp.]|nr:hypothetical protein [Arenibacter sp.]